MGNEDEKNSFNPMLYFFRVPPLSNMNKGFSIQPPFAVLFDNLIAVLWSVYGKDTKIKIGVNQIQWALELMKCMRVDFSYPEGIGKIVIVLEKQLLELYAKVGEKLEEIKEKQEKQEQGQKEEAEENNSQSSEARRLQNLNCLSYNERDVLDKMDTINIPSVTIETGELKLLKELNSLGRRKNKEDEACKIDKKTSKTLIIGALQKILDKTTEVQTKTDVEELIKELKVKKSNMPDGTKSAKSTTNN